MDPPALPAGAGAGLAPIGPAPPITFHAPRATATPSAAPVEVFARFPADTPPHAQQQQAQQQQQQGQQQQRSPPRQQQHTPRRSPRRGGGSGPFHGGGSAMGQEDCGGITFPAPVSPMSPAAYLGGIPMFAPAPFGAPPPPYFQQQVCAWVRRGWEGEHRGVEEGGSNEKLCWPALGWAGLGSAS